MLRRGGWGEGPNFYLQIGIILDRIEGELHSRQNLAIRRNEIMPRTRKTSSRTSKRTLPYTIEWQGPGKTPIRLKVNGQEHQLLVEPRKTLLDVLREDLGLTGAKRGCDEGTCGACTVMVEGRPLYSCMTLAIDCDAQSIETIEALQKESGLHPIQKAFIEEDAFQCGFCTPGQIMSAKSLLDRNPEPSTEEIDRYMTGNLCRCGAYPKIRRAIQRAARMLNKGD
jgi:xanthine dehydrogenase YagT iron-sulfur-binding subunit